DIQVLDYAHPREHRGNRDAGFLRHCTGPHASGVVDRVDLLETAENRRGRSPADVLVARTHEELFADIEGAVDVGIFQLDSGESAESAEAAVAERRIRGIAVGQVAMWNVIVLQRKVGPPLGPQERAECLRFDVDLDPAL